MAFSFTPSYRPAAEPPEEEEEEEDTPPMLRSGSVRAFSHLPAPAEDTASATFRNLLQRNSDRPAYEEEEEDAQPMPRSGGVRAFSHLPEGGENNAWNEHADAGRNEGSEPPATADDDDHGSIGPFSPRGAAPSAGRSLFLAQRPMPLEFARQQAKPYGAAPNTRDLLYRQGDKPGMNDLVYRYQGSAPNRLADIPGTALQQVAAKAGAPPAQRLAAGPAQPPLTAQQPPAAGAAAQKPAANGQPPPPYLTPEDQEELLTRDRRPRNAIGQLGIKGGTGFGPNQNGRPKTVCLYDGSEERAKVINGNDTADAIALQRAAREYATKGEWMIDISQPGWEEELRKAQRETEGEGKANDPHQGIDRIMIFDHASSGRHEFGSTIDPVTKQRVTNLLTPNSPAWKTITSSIKPQGDIVLTGCETARTPWNLTGGGKKRMPDGGPEYLDSLYYGADTSRMPTIHAYDEDVRHRTYKGRLSLTAGRQHTRSTGGYQVEGPDEPPVESAVTTAAKNAIKTAVKNAVKPTH